MARRMSTYNDDNGRVCTKCNQYVLYGNFSENGTNKKTGVKKYRSYCQECERMLVYEQRLNPEVRERHLESVAKSRTPDKVRDSARRVRANQKELLEMIKYLCYTHYDKGMPLDKNVLGQLEKRLLK